jgi:gamma-glutamyltranspeptidase / glutathione hydrolase
MRTTDRNAVVSTAGQAASRRPDAETASSQPARTPAFLVLLLLALPLAAQSRLPVRGKHAMVASVDGIASRVGADVMKRGGNAVDAAVAVAFALAVTWPEAGNLGGGGFMLVRTPDGKSEAIDYREVAPAAATRNMYLDAEGKVTKDSTLGYRASGVPGTVAGLALAHRRYGKLPWRALVEPARKLAADGFVVSEYLARSLKGTEAQRMKQFPESWRIFGDRKTGDRLVQPELAAVLARIANDPSDFYRGVTAKRIVKAMKEHGGAIAAEDLASYKPVLRTPLRGTYRGYEIVSMPPPSSGGIALIEMLNMLEPYDLKSMGWHSSQHVHTMVEVMRRAYADRAKFLGDPDFARVPVAGLVSKPYAEKRRADIDPAKATNVEAGDPAPYESPSTTHFSVADKEGMLVSNTYTLNDSYGSAVTISGFLMNDEMDDFASRPGTPNLYGLVQGEANAIQPRKRPLSSMTPAFVLKDGKPFLVAGSPGGGTIINTVLQVIVNIVDFGMSAQQAVDAPRFHHQWLPDEIGWEAFEFPRDTWDALVAMGHKFHATPGLVSSKTPGSIGDAECIAFDANGDRLGAADGRRGGTAVGW